MTKIMLLIHGAIKYHIGSKGSNDTMPAVVLMTRQMSRPETILLVFFTDLFP